MFIISIDRLATRDATRDVRVYIADSVRICKWL